MINCGIQSLDVDFVIKFPVNHQRTLHIARSKPVLIKKVSAIRFKKLTMRCPNKWPKFCVIRVCAAECGARASNSLPGHQNWCPRIKILRVTLPKYI
jgi:hypothetical protein